ncbi:hypothetical protein [Aneurinibacillus aneurinilyticus]|jgi:signal transduction histidine kinase|nr:hypothetical protein [Aneurinibacillus aneurinilyticus]MCI1694061.1 hypothetical protein [Aneurinibacillus aneurinilyticus]MED0671261.1 hypothetical protein [Aneurinibacillus aneurinilyticus]MED0708458.1 hypothetical protein [Aneurinibacillus aneurinilyticus]MED0723222.1 hypothetical protein [Aneurinibacillus aneurinilyticus]MED0732955.1 hypothetical protein [Aneurinibacillus aneurinilyticus]
MRKKQMVLWISAGFLASFLGGSVRVESEKGQGSRFSIHLSDVFHEQ